MWNLFHNVKCLKTMITIILDVEFRQKILKHLYVPKLHLWAKTNYNILISIAKNKICMPFLNVGLLCDFNTSKGSSEVL